MVDRSARREGGAQSEGSLMRIIGLLPCVLVCLVACKTTLISKIHDLEVPPGLSSQQVEFVILASLADNPPPRELSPELEIGDRALQAWFGPFYRSARTHSGNWFLEGRSPDVVYAGLQRRSHYLRVGLHYDRSEIRFVIEDSRNLKQSRWWIHRSAVVWIQELEIDIRRSLGQLSVRD
jgi:hypothetical protein